MESPSGEKSEIPAEERSGKLTRFPEDPGLRFRSTANLDKCEDAVIDVLDSPSDLRGPLREKLRRDDKILTPAFFEISKAVAKIRKVAEEKEEQERLLEGDLTHETTEGFGKASLKWVFVVLNLVVEVCQATLTQEAAQGKMRHQVYLKLSIATSSFCLVMSLVEAFHEGRSSGVKWQWRGCCGWFYHPGSPGRLFGRFSLYFGIICSMVQLLVNLITKLIGEDFVKFDYVPLLLSACYLVARIIASENKTDSPTEVNCKIHGRNIAKTKTVDGGKTLLYECPKCQEDSP